MSTVAYAQFLPEVLPFVPDCPQIVAVNAIRNACIDFCNKTWYWQVDLDPLPIVAKVSNYPIDVPSGTEFIGLAGCWIEGVWIDAQSNDELNRKFRGLDWRTIEGGNPRYVTQIESEEILLVPRPAETKQNALTIRAVIAPAIDSTEVGRDLLNHYRRVISLGARSYLHGTMGQPFSDLNLSEYFEGKFNRECSKVRIKVNKGLSRSSVTIQFPGFA